MNEEHYRSNLPAVIQSINESDLAEAFPEAMAKAFPDSRLQIECGEWFSLSFHAHSLPRRRAVQSSATTATLSQ